MKKIKSSIFSLIIGSILLQSACTPRPAAPRFDSGKPSGAQTDTGTANAQEGAPGDSKGQATNSGTIATPANPVAMNQMRSISITPETALALGAKAPANCAESSSSKNNGLGVYVRFEILEDATPLSVSVDRLCGDLSKPSAISITGSETGQSHAKQALSTNEITAKTLILNSTILPKGRYTLAIEVGGSKITDLSSLIIDGAVLEAGKNIRLEGISDF